MRRNTLLIDADDTLWENNVFYEKLIEDFVTVVEPYGYTRAYIRHILNETERKNIRQYGYGVRSFGPSAKRWRRFTPASCNSKALRRPFSMACRKRWRILRSATV